MTHTKQNIYISTHIAHLHIKYVGVQQNIKKWFSRLAQSDCGIFCQWQWSLPKYFMVTIAIATTYYMLGWYLRHSGVEKCFFSVWTMLEPTIFGQVQAGAALPRPWSTILCTSVAGQSSLQNEKIYKYCSSIHCIAWPRHSLAQTTFRTMSIFIVDS